MYMGEVRSLYNILVEKPEWKRPLESYKSRWKGNVRMDMGETR
jgi:hypothetical protein